MLPEDDSRIAIVVDAKIFSLNREGAPGRDQLGAIIHNILDAVCPNQLRGWTRPAGKGLSAKQAFVENIGFRPQGASRLQDPIIARGRRVIGLLIAYRAANMQ